MKPFKILAIRNTPARVSNSTYMEIHTITKQLSSSQLRFISLKLRTVNTQSGISILLKTGCNNVVEATQIVPDLPQYCSAFLHLIAADSGLTMFFNIVGNQEQYYPQQHCCILFLRTCNSLYFLTVCEEKK